MCTYDIILKKGWVGMYNHHLITFITVVEAGSFIKAAQRLYISPNAVTKQINILEDHLGLKLLNRSHRGVTLTDEGRIIYNGAKHIIEESNRIVDEAKRLEENKKNIIRVGVSLGHSYDILLKHWNKNAAYAKNFEFSYVPISDNTEDYYNLLNHLGEKIDIISDITDASYLRDRVNTFQLTLLPVLLAVPISHPLANKDIIDPSELMHETIIIPKRGFSPTIDNIFDTITTKCKNTVQFETIAHYNYETYNIAIAQNKLLFSHEAWKHTHPMFKYIPVKWGFKQPYGILYPLHPTKEVLSFIMALGRRA